MFDFILRKPVISVAQKYIDRLNPKVNVQIPKDLPLPSVGIIKKMTAAASQVNSFESQVEAMTDEQLRAKTAEFRKKYEEATQSARGVYADSQKQVNEAKTQHDSEEASNYHSRALEDLKKAKQKVLGEILPEAFAVVREASKRTVGMRHFDIQLVGGMVLHRGSIAEMATGEGKTLVATLPAYLNGLTGEGVHVVTVNDYLANRDREWMGPIYEFLGLTVGVIQNDMDPQSRRISYGCDIVYGTNNEFGFDYLRDNMVNDKNDMVQRCFNYAIVDEVDSILVDEARTPLIISGPAEESTDKYYRANDISKTLKGRRITERDEINAKYADVDLSTGFDYIADEKARSVSLTEEGEEKVAKMFGIDNLHDMETIEYRHHILQALKAKEFFKRDVDYVVRDGQVIIVDEFTGRMMPGRRWSDGLHQAVESKENIKIERENQTLATITLQNYFRMYEKLSGMTGTAHTEAAEFEQIYKLDCVVMPTNRVLQRMSYPDSIYKTVREKFAAVIDEIAERHAAGQPVLVGTISIENSELLSSMLKQRGVPHQVLNAKYHELEAQIVSQAGRFKAVTIATNMAGRGTDIVLGGNAEFLAKKLAEEKIEESHDDAQKQEITKKFIQQFSEQCKEEHEKVVAVGGLHVLGTERHESRRIDNQLRGRSGRQGDPGSSSFYVALEDDLMRLFASDRIVLLMDKLGMEEGQVIDHPLVSRAIEVAQRRVEGHNFDIRKRLLEFDNVMNRQREVIYKLRRSILESDNVKDRIIETIESEADAIVSQYLFSGQGQDDMAWDIEGMEVLLKAKYGFELAPYKEKFSGMEQNQVKELLTEGLLKRYEEKEVEVTAEHLRHIEKILLLQTIDEKWKDHLYSMDQLKGGIHLRAQAQRDPVVEFKREGLEMFTMMMDLIGQTVAETIFRIQPANHELRMRSVFGSLPQEAVHNEFTSLSRNAPSPSGALPARQAAEEAPKPQPYQNTDRKVGRNEPCPCGSGKKYKKCCGK